MRLFYVLLFSCVLLGSCKAKQPAIRSSGSNPTTTSSDHEPFFDITEYSSDKDYALSGDNPAKVGERSVSNQRRFLASLAGPNGEELTFHRKGSCCAYESENGFGGAALVDIYMVSYEGLKEPIPIYISFYDYVTLYIPKGFTKRN